MRGFSVIDLITALGLLAVISAIGYQSARIVSQRSAVRQIANSLLEELNNQAAQSMVSGTQTLAAYNKQKNEIVFSTAAPVSKQKLFALPPSLGITMQFGNLADRSTLELRPDGTATPGTITLADSTGVCRISQALWGARTLTCS
jgi:hypothetical protein